jgi:anti-sigma factor RsiW
VKEAWRAADLHAYVDDCLETNERLAFEAQMAQDPALSRRAAQWRAQNSAIRAAFDGESARTFSIGIVRQQNEAFGPARRSAAADGKPSSESMQRSAPAILVAPRIPANVLAPEPSPRSSLSRPVLAAAFFWLAFIWSPGVTVAPMQQLANAGVPAFEAFARPGVEPVEFATSDETKAQVWLTARLTHPVHLPATPATVKLIGARITPYPGAPAAFLMYKSQDGALGLLIRSLDAPSAGAPQLFEADGRPAVVWTEDSQGLALVGDPGAASLLRIATEFSGPD